MLRENPDLAHARSARQHQATLLHYVPANGVEDDRQRTPPNVVEIATILLDAGAEGDAVAGAYGKDTALALTATSVHPLRAGVLIPLPELLLERGGRVDGGPGVGRLDLVKSFFLSDGSLKPDATRAQMESGFIWACEYGRAEVGDFLLNAGVDSNTYRQHKLTGLHWAAMSRDVETVTAVLKHNPPHEARSVWGGTLLASAVWAATGADADDPARPNGDWTAVIQALLEAGADISAVEYPTGKPGIDKILRRYRAR